MNIIDLIYSQIDYLILFLNDENYATIFKIIYFIFLLIYQTIGLPGHVIFMLLAGFIYGTFLGFILCMISIVTGSFVFYIIGRKLLVRYFTNFTNKYIRKIDEYISGSKLEYLIIFRLFPGTPLIFQNLILSFLGISKTKFILATIIGNIPGIFVTVQFGDHIKNLSKINEIEASDIFTTEFYLSIFLIISLILIKIFLIKKNK